MADYTAVSDVVIPEVFDPYLIQANVNNNAYIRSGIMQVLPSIQAFLASGGDTKKIPYWARLTGTPSAIQSGTSLTPVALTTFTQEIRRCVFGQGWAEEDLAGALAGSNPGMAVANMVSEFWIEQFASFLNYTQTGIIADNVAADSSDLINDIASEDGDNAVAANKISDKAITDTIFLLGDAFASIVGISMHSAVYQGLAEQNLIDAVPNNVQDLGFGTYRGRSLIIDDNVFNEDGSTSGTKYRTTLYKRGGVGFGEGGYGAIGSGKIVMSETDRTAASGVSALYTRRQFVIAPAGYSFDGSISDETPTTTELATAGSWDRVDSAKNCGAIFLVTNG